jgi:hypothetical protein
MANLNSSRKPALHVSIPSMTVSLESSANNSNASWETSYTQQVNKSPSTSPESPSPTSAGISPRVHLLHTIAGLPDHVLSPTTWEAFSPRENTVPVTLCYSVPETNVAVEVTGYANGQFVVRVFCEAAGPVVAVNVRGGGVQKEEIPAWKVRETILERIAWDRELD